MRYDFHCFHMRRLRDDYRGTGILKHGLLQGRRSVCVMHMAAQVGTVTRMAETCVVYDCRLSA